MIAIVMAVLFLTLTVAQSGAGAPELLAHWKADEGSGTALSDAVSSYDGSILGNTAWTTGKIGDYALSFDGNTDYVDFGNVLNMDTNNFSVSLWFNASSLLTTDTSGGRMLDKRGTGVPTSAPGYFVGVYRSGSQVLAKNSLFDSAEGYLGFSTGLPLGNTEEWIHLVVSFDNEGNSWTWYTNGVQAHTDSTTALGSVNNTKNLWLGGTAGSQQWYEGKLDDIGIFSGLLSGTEAKAIYSLGDSILNYNLGQVQQLLALHAAGEGSVSIDEHTWFYVTGLTTDLGVLAGTGVGDFSLKLDASGTGVSDIVPKGTIIMIR